MNNPFCKTMREEIESKVATVYGVGNTGAHVLDDEIKETIFVGNTDGQIFRTSAKWREGSLTDVKEQAKKSEIGVMFKELKPEESEFGDEKIVGRTGLSYERGSNYMAIARTMRKRRLQVHEITGYSIPDILEKIDYAPSKSYFGQGAMQHIEWVVENREAEAALALLPELFERYRPGRQLSKQEEESKIPELLKLKDGRTYREMELKIIQERDHWINEIGRDSGNIGALNEQIVTVSKSYGETLAKMEAIKIRFLSEKS